MSEYSLEVENFRTAIQEAFPGAIVTVDEPGVQHGSWFVDLKLNNVAVVVGFGPQIPTTKVAIYLITDEMVFEDCPDEVCGNLQDAVNLVSNMLKGVYQRSS